METATGSLNEENTLDRDPRPDKRMDSLLSGPRALFLVVLLTLLCGVSCGGNQESRETDAVCSEDGCFVVYFQRKTFLDSWRACKKKGGTLATIKHHRDADAMASLFSMVDLGHSRSKVQVWIGLQRQPRQCSLTRPLRGFSWTTGDQDTEYTNWLRADSVGTCSVSRCVAMSYSHQDSTDNFKWLDGACSVSVDGYLCQYTYAGMCLALWGERAGSTLYSTPFNLVSSLLTHVPFGSVATVTCPNTDQSPAGGAEDQQSVLCEQKVDGSMGWSSDPPLCPPSQSKCEMDNGGCEHYCKQSQGHSYCECEDGYQLADNGLSCEPSSACESAPCQGECLPLSNGYHCACPDGYMLALDEKGCMDVDECMQSPCDHLCVNTGGSFQCECWDGFRLGGGGVCEDVDECESHPCEHICKNTVGSHICGCRFGFSVIPEEPGRCQDNDECQIPGTCEQMCLNYDGGFECYCKEGYELRADQSSCRKSGELDELSAITPANPWGTHQQMWDPEYGWDPQQGNTVWPREEDPSLDWLTDPPSAQDSAVIWVTNSPLDSGPHTPDDKGDLDSGGAFLLEQGQRSEAELEDLTPTVQPTGRPTEEPLNKESMTMESAEVTGDEITTESMTTPDWYDGLEEEEEETTPAAPLLSTSTISGGAWNWWARVTTFSQEVGNPEAPMREQNTPADPHDHGDEEQRPFRENPEDPQEEITRSPDPAVSSLLTPSQPPRSHGEGEGGYSMVDPEEDETGQKKSSLWLLVGLLVPLGIFVVVMVALGIVLCTRCSIQPRNKSTSDCYHWISGAHDKQGATSPSGGIKTCV